MVEGVVVVTVVSRSGEEGFMGADEAENVFADLLYKLPFLVHHTISTLPLSPGLSLPGP